MSDRYRKARRAASIGVIVLLFGAVLISSCLLVVAPARAQGFDNARIADCGLAELGTTRPTGWDQPGECIKSVQRWVAEAGGYFGYGGVISGYTNSGAVQISATEATKGDVCQWTNGNDSDWSHPHTVCIVQNYGNGRYWIVQSNWEAPGRVSENRNWDPNPEDYGRAGYFPTFWRFGEVAAPPPITGGHDVVGATAPASTFYFAEGSCRPGFTTYFCIQNPGAAAAEVTLTYMKGDATRDIQQVTVPPCSRATVSAGDKLGKGDDAAHDFSTIVQCAGGRRIMVERPMYFSYKGSWTGGHDVVGATCPATSLYFAEGTTRPGFDPYYCIQNPAGTEATVALTYMKGDGTTTSQLVNVSPRSRSTVHPADVLGTGDDASHDFSCRVTSTNGVGIVAERAMYFSYKGAWTGGSDVVGAPAVSECWYFAEGTTRPGFDPYITLQNPGATAENVTLTYMKGDGTSKIQNVAVPAHGRGTVHPSDVLGSAGDAAHDFSCCVACAGGAGIVAERAEYFDCQGWDGGHDAVGAVGAATTFYFAEGCCRADFKTYFCIQNPGSPPADVTITYQKGDGTSASQRVTVAGAARLTVTPAEKLGIGDDAAHDFSAVVQCTNGRRIVVERPMYFSIPRER